MPMTKIRCAITMGDPSGIGAEVIIKALSRPEIRRLADFVVIGDRRVLCKCQVSGVRCQVSEDDVGSLLAFEDDTAVCGAALNIPLT